MKLVINPEYYARITAPTQENYNSSKHQLTPGAMIYFNTGKPYTNKGVLYA